MNGLSESTVGSTTATVSVVGSSSAWARGVAGVATIRSATPRATAKARNRRGTWKTSKPESCAPWRTFRRDPRLWKLNHPSVACKGRLLTRSIRSPTAGVERDSGHALLAHRLVEPHRRGKEQAPVVAGPEPAQPDRPVGAVVNGEGPAGADPADRGHRLLGVEVVVAEGRPPAADRCQGDVDRTDPGDVGTESGVPREPRRSGLAGEPEAEGGRGTPVGDGAAPVVVRGQHLHVDTGDREGVAGAGLDHVQPGQPPDQPWRAVRDHDRRARREPPQRLQVQVVVVQVRDQHQVGHRPRGRPAGRPHDGGRRGPR